MNQKQIGIIIIIASLVVAGFVYSAKLKEDKAIAAYITATGSCYLGDGTCLHDDRDYTIYIAGFALSIGLLFLGLYITFIDKTQQTLTEHQVKITSALEEAKRHDKTKDEFNAFLAGFTAEEQNVLKAIKEQEGILQSTLRFKTGISKSSLSLFLKDLEERQVISRKPSGKTNQIYLRKRF